MVQNEINNQVDSIQVILDKRISLKLLQVSEGESVIYCNKFREDLFDSGVFSTKEKDFVHNYILENEQKYIITDVSTPDGQTYKNVKFRIIITEEKNVPFSTFNPNHSEQVILEKVHPIETRLTTTLENLEYTKSNDFDKKRLKQVEEQLENQKKKISDEFNNLNQKRKNLEEEKKKILNEKKEQEQEILKKYSIIQETKNDILNSSRKYIEEQVKAASEENKNYARKILELGSGGGSVAVQYANGGTINGDLNLNNLYPNNSFGQIGKATNRWNKIFANEIDALSANIIFELSGFSVDGNFTVNGIVSATGGNSNQWNSVYTTVLNNSAGWESVETSVNVTSANWNSVYTTTNRNSARWESTYTNLNTNSANYILDGGNTKGSNLFVGTNDNFNLSLETNNTARITLSSTGQVGIGTLNPTERLTVNGNISANGTLSTSIVNIGISPGGTDALFLNNNNIKGVNALYIADPGSNEGIIWEGGNQWGIWESPNDLSNTSGNLQFCSNVLTSSVRRMTLDTNGRLDVTGNLSVSGNSVVVGTGTFNHVQANTKSFYIDHPTKSGKKLQYGSLESPYHGVRLTGEDVVIKGICTVKLPDYMHALVQKEGINIQITNIKHNKTIYVDVVDLENNEFTVKIDTGLFDNKKYKFYWSFTATRKDIPELVVEV